MANEVLPPLYLLFIFYIYLVSLIQPIILLILTIKFITNNIQNIIQYKINNNNKSINRGIAFNLKFLNNSIYS